MNGSTSSTIASGIADRYFEHQTTRSILGSTKRSRPLIIFVTSVVLPD